MESRISANMEVQKLTEVFTVEYKRNTQDSEKRTKIFLKFHYLLQLEHPMIINNTSQKVEIF